MPGRTAQRTQRPRARTRRQLVGAIVGSAGAIVAALALSGLIGGAPGAPGPVSVSTRGPTRASPPGQQARAPAPISVSVTIERRAPGPSVPSDFLGLSFELTALRQIAAYADGGDLATMLRSLGPGVLRFGGASADTRVAWTDSATPLPPWASTGIDAGALRALSRLARRSGWRVLLTIGLAHFDPRAAAREAASARTALGGRLAGLELGNEPDAYARHGLRPTPWTLTRYAEQIAVYRRAIARAAPGVPLLGPDVSGSLAFERWGRAAVRSERPTLLTGHHYPLGCHDVPAPTVERLLSPQIRRAEDTSLRRYLSVSRAGRVGFRMDETNSVSCGGKAGVSDTFASALWALDYIARAMAAGVAGINLHGNPANCRGYTPVCASTPRGLALGALSAQPEWYALLLARALTGARPLGALIRPARANLDVRTLLDRHGRLDVVLVDEDPPGSAPTAVSVRTEGGLQTASVLSLSAPSPAATGAVTLGGRTVAADGSWHARATPLRAARDGSVTLTLPPSSAALLTATPAGGPRR